MPLFLQASLNKLDKHFRPENLYMFFIGMSNFYLYLYSVVNYVFEAKLAPSKTL